MLLNPEMTAKRECSDVLVSGDDAETPQWLGVEVPPGSENMAYLQRVQREHGRSHLFNLVRPVHHLFTLSICTSKQMHGPIIVVA